MLEEVSFKETGARAAGRNLPLVHGPAEAEPTLEIQRLQRLLEAKDRDLIERNRVIVHLRSKLERLLECAHLMCSGARQAVEETAHYAECQPATALPDPLADTPMLSSYTRDGSPSNSPAATCMRQPPPTGLAAPTAVLDVGGGDEPLPCALLAAGHGSGRGGRVSSLGPERRQQHQLLGISRSSSTSMVDAAFAHSQEPLTASMWRSASSQGPTAAACAAHSAPVSGMPALQHTLTRKRSKSQLSVFAERDAVEAMDASTRAGSTGGSSTTSSEEPQPRGHATPWMGDADCGMADASATLCVATAMGSATDRSNGPRSPKRPCCMSPHDVQVATSAPLCGARAADVHAAHAPARAALPPALSTGASPRSPPASNSDLSSLMQLAAVAEMASPSACVPGGASPPLPRSKPALPPVSSSGREGGPQVAALATALSPAMGADGVVAYGAGHVRWDAGGGQPCGREGVEPQGDGLSWGIRGLRSGQAPGCVGPNPTPTMQHLLKPKKQSWFQSEINEKIALDVRQACLHEWQMKHAVTVVCADLLGLFFVNSAGEFHIRMHGTGEVVSPNKFEELAGKKTARNWQQSIRLADYTMTGEPSSALLKLGHFTRIVGLAPEKM